MRRRPHLAVLGLATGLVLALAAVVALGGSSHRGSPPTQASSSPPASQFEGAALPVPVQAPGFTLTDQSGRRVSLSQFRGQVTVLTFLSSDCGPTCVLIAQQIRGALDELRRLPAVIVVSADPAADSPRRVQRFLSQASLSGRVRYLTGPGEQVRPVLRAYRIAPASAGAGAFARTASVVLVDRRGSERVLFGLEQLTPESLSHDIRRLQAG